MYFRKFICERKLLMLIGIAGGCVLSAGGCKSVSSLVASGAGNEFSAVAMDWPCEGSPGDLARRFYALACDAADDGDTCAPDYFYQAAALSWPCLPAGDGDYLCPADAWQIYHASVVGLIREGQRFDRFQRGKLVVHQPGETMTISVACLGLPWEASDVSRMVVAEPDTDSRLANYHSCPGFGVPVVAVRERSNCPSSTERFFAQQVPFAATVLLRPQERTAQNGSGEATLELYGPLEVSSVQVDGQSLVMAKDISAPFDYQLRTTERLGMLGFLDPDLPEEMEGLRFVEPYQPGKIPIVFIHGLMSDPSTWFSTANDLREAGWFNERYQIWAFRYASGKPFITSAMYLRAQLQQAVVALDPECRDPALRQMVLVGHSMGGLVAKLQVTESGDQIWNSFASVPFESVHAPGQVRGALAERCFFDPQPFVKRVIFVATPHGGSSFATRGVGRLGAAMVKPAEETEELHELLVAANPDVFSPQFERRVPTSIDMLEPEDPTLLAIRAMRVSPRVRLHSIIGTGGTMLTDGPGDGAVTVASALHPGVISQRFVDATHTEIQRHPDTQSEMRAILSTHLVESRAQVRPADCSANP